MMSETVKTQTSAETLTEEERRRREFNSRIGENYRRMMTMDGAALRNEVKTQERQYPSLDAYRPLHARREITFEDVQIPEEIRRETEGRAPAAGRGSVQAKSYSPVQDFQSSIYAAPGYREAALRRELASARQSAAAEAPAEDDALSMPTATTLQYGSATEQANAKAAALPLSAPVSFPHVIATPAEDARAYYAALLKKVAVAFAVALTLMLIVVAVNSAILSGMNAEMVSLQQTLDALAAQAGELQEQVNAFLVPGENGVPPAVWDFILQNGMVAA